MASSGYQIVSTQTFQTLRPSAYVASQDNYALAIADDGAPFSFGLTYLAGATDVPTSVSNAVAVAVGTPRLALKDDGTVVGWLPANYIGPADPSGVLNSLTGLTGIIDIAMRENHGLALKGDHTVTAFGYNGHGETNVPAGLNNVIAIAAGISHCLVLKSNGTVTAWGDNSMGQTNVPAGLSNVVMISAGSYHNLALKSDGTVVAWGDNSYEQCDVPSTVSNVVYISAGHVHSAALVKQPAEAVAPASVQRVGAGDPVTLSFVATGYGPLYYQWQFNGTNIPGATNSVLSFANVPISYSGPFQCLVSNSFGMATSSLSYLFPYRRTPVLDASSIQGLSTNGSFGFSLKYLSGHGPIVVEGSTNLTDWEPVRTNPPTAGSLEFFDTGNTNRPSLFYRAIEQ